MYSLSVTNLVINAVKKWNPRHKLVNCRL